MKRGSNEISLTSEQCNRVFLSLEPAIKRTLLQSLAPNLLQIGDYVEPSTLRDILRLIIQYCDPTTWSRLKRVSKKFNEYAGTIPPQLVIIRENIGHYKHPLREKMFYFCAKRFLEKTNFTLKNSKSLDYYMEEIKMPSMIRSSLPFTGARRITYPEGYIMIDGKPRGTIFDSNIENLLCIDVKHNPNTVRFRYVNEYSSEMKRIYQRVVHEWTHRNK